jgi:serine/threonine-protein kinase ULK4
LIDTLRDSNEKVRRRAIAALGEYMFYAATQLDDEMADPVWELSDDAIEIIV